MINNENKKIKGLFILIFALVLYLLIWSIKGQPLLTKVGNTVKYTYSTELEINDKEFTDADLNKLKRFEWVEKANINLWRLNNLECIGNMNRLKTLLIGIYASTSITDWDGISNCTNLETVYISGGELQNLSAFSKLKNLKSLSLEWANEGAEIDLKNVSELSSLEYLIIEGYTIKNPDELKYVHTLKSIIVKGKTENFILSCPDENLEILSYSAYGESKIDANDFLRFNKLKSLSIYNIRIDNIELLSNLKALETIDLEKELYSEEELVFQEDIGLCIGE